MRIGVIGTGVIATAVVESIARDGHQIIVSERSVENSRRLAAQFDAVSVAPNQAVLEQCDTVLIALMANQAADVLEPLDFDRRHQVISLMAGVSRDAMIRLTAPARFRAVMLPFPNVAQPGAPVLVQGETGLVRELFAQRNSIFEAADAAELDAYLSAQAVLSPAVQLVNDAAKWLGARVNDSDQGERFLRELVGSNLVGGKSAALLKALSTPGGYNQRLREHMVQRGMGAALTEGLDGLEKPR